jgi:L-arabinokinase
MARDHRASSKIVYYISGHGFGHAVRSIQIINELIDLGCQIWIKTTAPEFLFREGLSQPVKLEFQSFDVGLYQLDNIRFDLEKTKERVKDLLNSAETLIAKEQQFLLAEGISGVVCDIPFIPLTAAARIGLPAIGISNFSWDWIYSFFGQKDPDWNPLVETINRYYQAGDLFLRLPFYGETDNFRQVEDIPLVARHSHKSKEDIRQILGLPKDRKIGLIGYSQVDLKEKAIGRVERLATKYLFLTNSLLNWKAFVFKRVESTVVSYLDMIRVADFVITKPGYGIVSDCLAHGTPMIYSNGGMSPEYPILVEGIKQHLSCCYMPKKELYSGNWGPYLEKLTKQTRLYPRVKTNGAQVAGRRIVEWIGKRGPASSRSGR